MAKRFSKNDWLDLGLKALTGAGPEAIRIDGLCARAGRTKGSFYHHFDGRDVFIAALMGRWEARLTQAIIDNAEREATAQAKLRALTIITTDMAHDLDVAVRRWAASDAVVARAVEAVDKRRTAYVASLLRQIKALSKQEAMDLAVMNYAALIGFQLMPVSAARRRRIDQIFGQLLDRLPDS
ncbi:MAG: TetR/AcrR family transcriptional regulator [Robiginitomaculum sp.]